MRNGAALTRRRCHRAIIEWCTSSCILKRELLIRPEPEQTLREADPRHMDPAGEAPKHRNPNVEKARYYGMSGSASVFEHPGYRALTDYIETEAGKLCFSLHSASLQAKLN